MMGLRPHPSRLRPEAQGLTRLRLSDLATAFAEDARSYDDFLDRIVADDGIAFSSAAAIARFHEVCTSMRAKLEDMNSLFSNQMAKAEEACPTRIEISAGNGEIVNTQKFLIDPTRPLRCGTNSATVLDVTRRLRDYIGSWSCAKREELGQELRDAFRKCYPPVPRRGAQSSSSECHEGARYIFRERVDATCSASRLFRVPGFLTIAWELDDLPLRPLPLRELDELPLQRYTYGRATLQRELDELPPIFHDMMRHPHAYDDPAPPPGHLFFLDSTEDPDDFPPPIIFFEVDPDSGGVAPSWVVDGLTEYEWNDIRGRYLFPCAFIRRLAIQKKAPPQCRFVVSTSRGRGLVGDVPCS